jgi:hypothetical protein
MQTSQQHLARARSKTTSEPNLAVLPFDESGADGRALLPHRNSPARDRIADPQYARDPSIPIFWSPA